MLEYNLNSSLEYELVDTEVKEAGNGLAVTGCIRVYAISNLPTVYIISALAIKDSVATTLGVTKISVPDSAPLRIPFSLQMIKPSVGNYKLVFEIRGDAGEKVLATTNGPILRARA